MPLLIPTTPINLIESVGELQRKMLDTSISRFFNFIVLTLIIFAFVQKSFNLIFSMSVLVLT